MLFGRRFLMLKTITTFRILMERTQELSNVTQNRQMALLFLFLLDFIF
jgi:hypothetical protein